MDTKNAKGEGRKVKIDWQKDAWKCVTLKQTAI